MSREEDIIEQDSVKVTESVKEEIFDKGLSSKTLTEIKQFQGRKSREESDIQKLKSEISIS